MFLDDILDELKKPTGVDAPAAFYVAGVIGVAHAMLGAAIYAGLGSMGAGLAAAVRVAVGYWMLKERGDLRRGGGFWDGLEDTLMVSLGAWYGAWWWPLCVLGCGGYIMAARLWRAR